jgi:hypothetical protein
LKNSEIKQEFKAKGLQEANEKMRTDNLEGSEKADYEAYIKGQRIRESEIETAVFDAKSKVKDELLPIIQKQESELQRKENEFLNMVRNMKKRGLSNEEIAQITGKGKKEIEGI